MHDGIYNTLGSSLDIILTVCISGIQLAAFGTIAAPLIVSKLIK